MADNRIAGLSAITQIDTSLDFIPIVDVSDPQMANSGTTKKITINQILAAGTNVVVPAGTAGAPSISFSGDSNTGIYAPAADQLSISSGGSGNATVSSTGLSVTGSVSATSTITGTQLISTVAIGTAPLSITSTTVVSNLNADLLDGQHGSFYRDADNITAGTLAVTRGGTGVTTSTGTGSVVLSISPTLSGTPVSTTAVADTNTTQIATTAYVIGQASSTAPAALGSANVGTSLKYARADHVHALPTIDLSNGVTGTLPVANGGTGASTFTAGRILFGNGTNAIATSSSLNWDSSNNRLGIGTGDPGYEVDVVAPAGVGVQIFENSTTTNKRLRITQQTDHASYDATFTSGGNAHKWKTGSTERFAIDGNGIATWSNVGGVAGTAMTLNGTGLGVGVSPNRKLEVAGGSSIPLRLNNTGSNCGIEMLTSSGTTSWLLGAQYNVGNAFEITPSTAVGGTTFSTPAVVVTASGNVGIGTATPGLRLDVVGFGRFQSTTGSSQVVLSNDGGLLNFAIDSSTGGNFGEAYSKNIYCTGAQPLRFWTNGVDRMRIDSTGNVGIGTTTPDTKLHLSGTGNQELKIHTNTSGNPILTLVAAGQDSASILYNRTDNYLSVNVSAITGALRLTTSGNLGLGVTPSAWSLGRAFENSAGAFFGYSTSELHVTQNAYYNAGWKYTNSSVGAGRYFINGGAHSWFTAPSGTAGNAITFTQAMTLDASGNLGLGATTTVGGRLVITQDNSVQPAIYLPVDESTILGPNANTFLKFGGNLSAKGAGTLSMQCGTGVIQFVTGSSPSEKMRLDGSGNLGLGVTPKVWNGNYRAIQIGLAGAIFNDNFNEDLNVSSNAYYDSTDNRYEFIRIGYAQRYTQTNGGQHRWYTSTSAGNADAEITFTQAMTLDASGNLLVGSTGIISGTAGIQIGTGKQLIFDNGTGQNSSPISNVDSALIYTSGAGGTFGFNGHLVLQPRGSAAGAIIMATGSGAGAMAERLRIKSTGQLNFVGLASDPAGAAGDVYYNSTSSKLKFYDSAWKTIPASDQVSAANGTVGAPSISFESDTNTGIYRSAADTLHIATGGVAAVRVNPNGSFGYVASVGGAVEQATSRTTGVTLNKACGAITLVSAAGSTSWQTFTVTNNTVDATDVVKVCQKSGTDIYQIHVTNVLNGSFKISFATTGGTTTEQPVFNFAVIKAGTGDPV